MLQYAYLIIITIVQFLATSWFHQLKERQEEYLPTVTLKIVSNNVNCLQIEIKDSLKNVQNQRFL